MVSGQSLATMQQNSQMVDVIQSCKKNMRENLDITSSSSHRTQDVREDIISVAKTLVDKQSWTAFTIPKDWTNPFSAPVASSLDLRVTADGSEVDEHASHSETPLGDLGA